MSVQTYLKRRDTRRFMTALLSSEILAYPHSTRDMANKTAEEFILFGKFDAQDRGISDEDWLWKRSRYLAGYH